MKKEYTNPKMEVVKIQTQQILAASPLEFGNPVDDAGDAESPEYTGF